MSEPLIATTAGACYVCTYEISAGESFAWGTERGQRRHVWCDPPPPPGPVDPPSLSDEDKDIIVEEVADELAARLQDLHTGLDPWDLADMVAHRLARPVADAPMSVGTPIGSMCCSRCGATWEIANGAAFTCTGCGYAA